MMHFHENRRDIQLIHVSTEMFLDLPRLQSQFTELYLGREFEYQLEFDLFYLPVLNRIFDEIIFKYGFQKVSFRFPSHCDFYSFKKALTRKGLK